MGELLDEAWDRERFADDPRKRKPVFAFDADNHLLVAFEVGTAKLREALRKSSGSSTSAVTPATRGNDR